MVTAGGGRTVLAHPGRAAAPSGPDHPPRTPAPARPAANVHLLGFTEFTIPLPVAVFRFMAVPLFHRGARVGHVFVGDREDGEEFSQEDEETLVMFAAQAATKRERLWMNRPTRQDQVRYLIWYDRG